MIFLDNMTLLLALVISMITEWGVVSTHVWAREDHTHWAHTPYIKNLGISNWFHVASFCSHWPMQAFLHYYIIPVWLWPVTILISMYIWEKVKKSNNKLWDKWFIQIWKKVVK